MTIDIARTLDDPVTCILLIESAFVADPFLHFSVDVFTARDTIHFISLVPEHDLA
jgi:hypothetical protein